MEKLKKFILLLFLLVSLGSFALLGYYYLKKDQSSKDSGAATADIIWSSGHEDGTYNDWKKNQSGAFYPTGNGVIEASKEAAHSGNYSLKHQVTGISSQMVATRIFRWAEHLREGYYSCWYMFPQVPQVNGWLNIFQFKKHDYEDQGGTGAIDPTWYNTVYNGRLYLNHWHSDSDVDNVDANVATPPQIVPGQWFHIEWHYKDGINDGEIGVWIDGQQYWDLKNVETRGVHPDIQWAPSLYGQRVTPDPLTMYIDDCAISTTRLGPNGLNGGETPTQKCTDDTIYGQCSSTKPKYCNNGTLENKCSTCGCPDGKECQNNGACVVAVQKCSDDTVYGQCSTAKPKYCNNGTLENKCDTCGCPDGKTCQSNGTCTTTSTQKCTDGTVYGRCSATKPKYCNNGTLINNCSICSCPAGKSCESDGHCEAPLGIDCGPMDVNGDNKLTIIDLSSFVRMYRKACKDTAPTTGCKGKDTNGDKKITLVDLSNFVRKYGKKSCL
jgi:hypothetical protein